MSPTIPILSALLLSLISGSTEGRQRMDPVVLLRQTLRYWWKIYKTYHEEVALGYCWADYLLEISDELSTNLSVSLPAATGDRNTSVGATKSQKNPFPQNAMADATMPLRETQRKGKHLREKRSHTTAGFAISRFANDSDEQRSVSRVKLNQERWMNGALPIISNYEETSEIGNKRITRMNALYIQKKRQASPIVPVKLFHDQREILRRHEFSSEMCSGRCVNPLPNPTDEDDKDGFESTDTLEKEGLRILHSHSTNYLDFFLKDTSVLRNLFLLTFFGERSLGDHRLPFRRYPQTRERKSRVNELLLSNPRTPEEGREMKRDPEGDRIPLNNSGSLSRFQLRRTNAVKARYTGIVKLTNSVGNASCDPARAINSGMSRWKPGELSRDSLLSLRRGRVGAAKRLPDLESRESGRGAVKREALSRVGEKIAGGSDAKKRNHQQPGVEERSRVERDVSTKSGMIQHPFFLSRFERSLPRQMTLYENLVPHPVIPTFPERSRRDDDRIRAARGAPSLSRVGRFIENYENSTSGSIRNSRLTALQDRQLSLRSIIISVLRTLGIFVQVGRQIMNVVESNTVLACTKEYLWIKIIRWIDG